MKRNIDWQVDMGDDVDTVELSCGGLTGHQVLERDPAGYYKSEASYVTEDIELCDEVKNRIESKLNNIVDNYRHLYDDEDDNDPLSLCTGSPNVGSKESFINTKD